MSVEAPLSHHTQGSHETQRSRPTPLAHPSRKPGERAFPAARAGPHHEGGVRPERRAERPGAERAAVVPAELELLEGCVLRLRGEVVVRRTSAVVLSTASLSLAAERKMAPPAGGKRAGSVVSTGVVCGETHEGGCDRGAALVVDHVVRQVEARDGAVRLAGKVAQWQGDRRTGRQTRQMTCVQQRPSSCGPARRKRTTHTAASRGKVSLRGCAFALSASARLEHLCDRFGPVVPDVVVVHRERRDALVVREVLGEGLGAVVADAAERAGARVMGRMMVAVEGGGGE